MFGNHEGLPLRLLTYVFPAYDLLHPPHPSPLPLGERGLTRHAPEDEDDALYTYRFGITFSAKRRIDFFTSSWGTNPPRLNQQMHSSFRRAWLIL